MKRVYARKRTQSHKTRGPSKTWQAQDSFFQRAKASGYVARSVFKLQQIHERFRLIQPSHRVLDLGCAPGSWLQYVAEKLDAHQGGCAVGIDLKPVKLDFKSYVHVLQADVFDVQTQTLLLLGQKTQKPRLFDVVLSDMAPNTSGVKLVDQQRSLQLCERVLQLTCEVLRKGGSLCVKVFEGEDLQDYCNRCKALFQRVRIQRPQATRSSSKEVYVVALGFRGGEFFD